jgi:tetratricopeptide (TPR) repeat protein
MRRAFVIVCAGLIVFVAAGCRGQADHAQAIERHKKLASELRDNHLYQAAVEEYRKILDYDDLEPSVRANINYLIGRLYFENIEDYDQAAAYYVRARALDPEGSFMSELSRNLVASLEKSGNIVNARRQLTRATDIDVEPASDSDVIVAKIGDMPVWLSQVDDAIETLPPNLQREVTNSRQSKVDFMHQYVASELLYHAALRENMESDPEIKRKAQQFKRQLLIEKYVLANVIPKIQIDTADVRNFYVANRDARYDGAPYDSVKAQVFLDYQSQKAQSAYQDYISMLSQNEKVRFLDQNVK